MDGRTRLGYRESAYRTTCLWRSTQYLMADRTMASCFRDKLFGLPPKFCSVDGALNCVPQSALLLYTPDMSISGSFSVRKIEKRLFNGRGFNDDDKSEIWATFVANQVLGRSCGNRAEQGSRVRSVCIQSGGELHEGLHDPLEVLQLFARKEQPGAEEQVTQIGLQQREDQIVDLVPVVAGEERGNVSHWTGYRSL